eukprot:gene27093-58246_t
MLGSAPKVPVLREVKGAALRGGLEAYIGRLLLTINDAPIGRVKDIIPIPKEKKEKKEKRTDAAPAAPADAECSIELRKEADEGCGVVFDKPGSMLLKSVKGAAERCGAARFVGHTLSQINGAPVSSVKDIKAASSGLTVLTLRFAPPPCVVDVTKEADEGVGVVFDKPGSLRLKE